MKDKEKLDILLKHIQNVHANAMIIAKALIGKGDIEREFALNLMSTCLNHDNSKFDLLEFTNLWDYVKESDLHNFKFALDKHQHRNFHHPEHWGTVNMMPEVYLAEMVCDWFARCEENSMDYSEWLVSARERFKIDDISMKKILKYSYILAKAKKIKITYNKKES